MIPKNKAVNRSALTEHLPLSETNDIRTAQCLLSTPAFILTDVECFCQSFTCLDSALNHNPHTFTASLDTAHDSDPGPVLNSSSGPFSDVAPGPVFNFDYDIRHGSDMNEATEKNVVNSLRSRTSVESSQKSFHKAGARQRPSRFQCAFNTSARIQIGGRSASRSSVAVSDAATARPRPPPGHRLATPRALPKPGRFIRMVVPRYAIDVSLERGVEGNLFKTNKTLENCTRCDIPALRIQSTQRNGRTSLCTLGCRRFSSRGSDRSDLETGVWTSPTAGGLACFNPSMARRDNGRRATGATRCVRIDWADGASRAGRGAGGGVGRAAAATDLSHSILPRGDPIAADDPIHLLL
ncbi:hypothetical protein EVAR_17265_1 [Eumeta japonica]|uniref:Uncharacterized protein n=1 Tax=Eumeta variegata TaxID=151549 RepID=A0A4C1TT25_EUMVA|nr:hypothetical protein EVAR_17265_1 [Eumeta japonica]